MHNRDGILPEALKSLQREIAHQVRDDMAKRDDIDGEDMPLRESTQREPAEGEGLRHGFSELFTVIRCKKLHPTTCQEGVTCRQF